MDLHAATGLPGPALPRSRSAGLSIEDRHAAFMRVAEKRFITQSGFWGQPHSDRMSTRAKRHVPAFWSVSSHGQPFNDERLTDGSSNMFKAIDPPKFGSPPPKPVGPATESLATLKSSLQNGIAMFGRDKQMTPLEVDPTAASILRV